MIDRYQMFLMAQRDIIEKYISDEQKKFPEKTRNEIATEWIKNNAKNFRDNYDKYD
jgi:hypothetical protein